ncbi:HAD family hydrolase [Allocoleopsis franciscana]|uniref:Putative phosphatase n=1 Tax=Allocoleopsis franciscana PCC 7113 TaxID=1173027 RepID=K9WB75_9CYAN|nr:HAD hydrolase-like protein [Allocoleopsis franciscana]AFZ17488.1 putative phosphatase [Allocoleopsis franciscana PCC 7113]
MIGVATSDLQPPQCYPRHNPVPRSHHLTVFCDFDGPIVDVSQRYYSTYQLALADTQEFYQRQGRTLPIQRLQKQQFWQMKQDRVPDVEIAMRSGLQGEQIDFFLGRVIEIVNQPALLNLDRLQPGVSWALALLHSQRVRLVLVTLRCQEQATQILRNHGLTRLFSGIYGTNDRDAAYHNYAEGKTQLLAKAIEEQPLLTGHQMSAWMIGDTEADLLAGQALSIPTIALTCGIRSRMYLKQFHPTRIHTDLLSAAHYILESLKVEG